MSELNAFDVLSSLASKSEQSAVPLPAQVEAEARQSGIGFSLLGCRFMVPMGQVLEMLDVPASTRLPGVQPWVIGLSNVRGRLLPLFDMAHFFGSANTGNKKRQRVLVVDNEQLYSGLIVDQSYGMQHFTRELYTKTAEDVPEPIAPYTKGAYVDASGGTWVVFDIEQIINDSRFLNAAAVA